MRQLVRVDSDDDQGRLPAYTRPVNDRTGTEPAPSTPEAGREDDSQLGQAASVRFSQASGARELLWPRRDSNPLGRGS